MCIIGNMNRALATEYTQKPDTISNADVVCMYTVPVERDSMVTINKTLFYTVLKVVCSGKSPMHFIV